MSRYIDADAVIEKIPTVMDMQDVYLPIHFKEWLIDDAPSIDIVRCKECKHREEYMCRGIDDDFFCADGERRES